MKQERSGSELAGSVDSHQTMANGKYLNYMLLQPVVDPVAVMVAENLADLRAFDFGECLSAHFGIVGKSPDRLHHLVFKPSSILGIEVAFKIFTVGSDAVLSALGYHDSHTAARMRFVFDFALRSSRARRSWISFSKSSMDTTSPRSASPSAARRSAYASIFSIFSRISSNAARSMNTYEARPFCVSRRGRPLLRARAAQSERLLRNSDIGTMSSLGLRLIMGDSCGWFVKNIVQNIVESVNAVELNAERKRGMSVLVCGLLQRFQRSGVEEKRYDAYEGDAVAVGPGLFVWVAGHNDLPEVVADVTERESLLFALFVVGDVPCGLDVKAHVAFVDDEIHFVALAAALAVDGREHLHDTDINRVVAPNEFVVDGILHEMRVFVLPEVEPGIADAGIDGIVFGRVVEVAVSAQVKEPCILDEEGRFKITKVFANGRFVAGNLASGVYRIAESCGIGKTADVAHGRVGHYFKKGVVLEVVSLDDVAKVDGSVEIVKIAPLFGFGFKKGAFGEPAEREVGVANLEGIPGIGHRFCELCERKRGHRDGFAASTELGGYILREKVGVGAGDVCGDVLALEKSVEDMVEGDVGFGAIFGAQARERRAFGQYWLRMLDFIDKHETRCVVSRKSGTNLLAEGNCIAAEKKVIGFKVDFHDVVWGSAAVKQMLLEEIEQEEALATTAHAYQNLDEIMVLCLYQLVQKDVSFDNHKTVSALKLCANARKFKTQVVYQFAGFRSSETLNFCACARKFKAKEAARNFSDPPLLTLFVGAIDFFN